MPILVVGSTGFVGSQIALKLQQKTRNVRALLRGGSAHPKAQALKDAAIEISVGDLTVTKSLADACRGAETVVCTATSMPSGANDGLRRVDHQGCLALIEAAKQAGAKKFIYVSYSGNIREDSPLETAKRECENRLLQSPMQAVILRPSYFMEVWLSPALGFDPANATARIYGDGKGKVNYISAFDVADFAVAAATRDYESKNRILEMGGPDPVSQLDAVAIFEQKRGQKFKLDYVPVDALRAQHSSTDPLQKTFGALMLAYTRGDVIPGAKAVAQECEIRLRSVAEYASGYGQNQPANVA